MRVVLQRVLQAEVQIDGRRHAGIGEGLLILLGIESEDTETDIQWLTRKIVQMRIFSDDKGKMNRSILDTGGEILVVSQFTLHASTKKGNRPSFIKAARPDLAIPAYEKFVRGLDEATGHKVSSGVFGASMKVTLTNDGPVTIIVDSKMQE